MGVVTLNFIKIIILYILFCSSENIRVSNFLMIIKINKIIINVIIIIVMELNKSIFYNFSVNSFYLF